MNISVINHTRTLRDLDVHTVIRAVNRQIHGDFAPYWSMGATLRLEGRSASRPSGETLSDMRGDAVLYLWDEVNVDDALGYHDLNHRGIPFGFVFTELAREVGEHWSVTLSHEALELIADPDVNLLVMGPHPVDGGRTVFHWYEMCDAVQAEAYEIDGVGVSNFVLPLYFTGGDESGGRNDFLGMRSDGRTLRSFGVKPGGYVGFYDPEKQDMDTFDADPAARARRQTKARATMTRRGVRYGRYRTVETRRSAPSRRGAK